MAYYLGKDVNVILQCETVSGLAVSAAGEVTASLAATYAAGIPKLGTAVFTTNAMNDVTGLDLGIGSTDEDVSYLGLRTQLKAEIHKETTVSFTLKKKNKVYDAIFNHPARWGTKTGAIFDGYGEPTTEYGFRVYVQLKSGEEIFVVRSCTFSGHTVTLNADGTQEETIDFVSQVDPKIYPASNSTGISGAVALSEL